MAFNKTQYRKIDKAIKESLDSALRQLETSLDEIFDPEILTNEDIQFITEMIKQHAHLKLIESH